MGSRPRSEGLIREQKAAAKQQMTEGRKVIADYGHTGLTVRHHPMAFLATDMEARKILTYLIRQHSERLITQRETMRDD